MSVRAGRLRHRVTIQSRSQSLNEYGEPSNSWASAGSVWAAVEPARQGEGKEADGRQATATHLVTIRYLAGVDPTDRVVFGSRTLDIVGVANPEERNDRLLLTCRERV